jgi:hypothetical protein
MKLRTMAVLGGLGVAALALIGAGASATFSTQTTSSQSITAGTLSVVLYAGGATGNGTPSITLPNTAPVGSTFATSPTLIQIYNNGNITATEISMQLTDTNNNGTLEGETWACMYSDQELAYNEPLTTVEGYGSVAIGPQTLAPGASDYYTLVFYAGAVDTGCGATFTGIVSGVYTSYEPYVGSAPTLGDNPSAASLTSPAEGGTLIPAFTVTYTG